MNCLPFFFHRTRSQWKCVLFLLLLGATLPLSCKKGDPGPAGPAGAPGPTGPGGAGGPAGPAGTANVIYSNWASATTFRDTVMDNSKFKVANVAAMPLVDSILNQGTILVYVDFAAGVGVFPLPYTSYAGGIQSTISFLPQRGNILLTRFTADNSGAVGLSPFFKYRYILIPGGVVSTSYANATHQGQAAVFTDGNPIDYSAMSYAEVCNKLHIPM